MSYRLKTSGLLESTEETLILTDLLKEFQKQNQSSREISYNSEKSAITVIIDESEYEIALTEEQKYKYENGISDPNLDQLKKIIEIQEKAEYQRRVINNLDAGVEPTDIKAISIYSNYLKKEWLRTCGAICAVSALTLSPFIIFGISLPIIHSAINNPALWKIILAAILDFVAVVGGIVLTIDSVSPYSEIELVDLWKSIIDYVKELYLKSKNIGLYKKQLSIINSINISESLSVKESEIFFSEIQSLTTFISGLPQEKRINCGAIIKEIMEEYKKKAPELIKSGGDSTEVEETKHHALIVELKRNLIEKMEGLLVAENSEEISKRIRTILGFNDHSYEIIGEGNNEEIVSSQVAFESSSSKGWTDDLTEEGPYRTMP